MDSQYGVYYAGWPASRLACARLVIILAAEPPPLEERLTCGVQGKLWQFCCQNFHQTRISEPARRLFTGKSLELTFSRVKTRQTVLPVNSIVWSRGELYHHYLTLISRMQIGRNTLN